MSTTTPVLDREPDGRGRAGVVLRRGPGRGDHHRTVLTVALGPVLAGLAAAAFLLLVVLLLAPQSDLTTSRVARATGAAWLAGHQVQLEIQGAPLGVLPLLPTVLLALLVARMSYRAAQRSGMNQPADAALLAVAAGGGHAVVGCLVAVWISTPGTPDVSASPLGAAVGCGLVTGLAVLCGLAGPCGLVAAAAARCPEWVGHAVAAASRAAAVLATAGLGAVLVGLVSSAATVRDLFATGAPDGGSATGLGLLSAGYLPNAGIWGSSWLAGPGVSLGGLSSSPFDTTGQGIPPVPLLGALPTGPAQAWWPVFLVVPVAAGVLLGRRVTRLDGLGDRIRAVLTGCALAGLGLAAAGWLSGGRLGTGAYDPVEVPVLTVALTTAGWFLLGALPVACWSALRGRPVSVPRPGLPSRRRRPAPVSVAESVTAARTLRYGALAAEEPAPPDDLQDVLQDDLQDDLQDEDPGEDDLPADAWPAEDDPEDDDVGGNEPTG